MVVKRESNKNSQAREPLGEAQTPHPVTPTDNKNGDIDALVSSFLTELTEISYEMKPDRNVVKADIMAADPGPESKKPETPFQTIDPEPDTKPMSLEPANKPETDETLVNPQLILQEEVPSPTDFNSEIIDREIEQSLAELERLKPETPFQMADPKPDTKLVSLEPAPSYHVKSNIEIAQTSPPPVPEKQSLKVWKISKGIIIRHMLVLCRSKRIRMLASTVLVAILGLSVIYLLLLDIDASSVFDKITISKSSEPEQVSEGNSIARISSKASPSPKELEQGSRSASASIQKSSQSKLPSSSAAKAVEDGTDRNISSERKSRPSTAEPTTSRSTATTDIDNTSSRTNMGEGEESARQTAAYLRSAPEAPTEKTPSKTPLKSPSDAASQSESGQENPVSEAVAVAEQTLPEKASTLTPIAALSRNGSAAEKTAPFGDTPTANASVQPKPRIPERPEVISKVLPEYPPIARNQKITGTVEVEVDIDERGNVVRAKALSGPMLLYKVSEEAIMKWKFKPASIDGINTSSKTRVSIAFTPQ